MSFTEYFPPPLTPPPHCAEGGEHCPGDIPSLISGEGAGGWGPKHRQKVRNTL